MQPTSVFSIILVILLRRCLFAYEIIRFQNNPGLYFEFLGHIKNTADHYTLKTHIDLEVIKINSTKISEQLHKILIECTNLQIECRAINSRVSPITEKLIIAMDLFNQINKTDNQDTYNMQQPNYFPHLHNIRTVNQKAKILSDLVPNTANGIARQENKLKLLLHQVENYYNHTITNDNPDELENFSQAWSAVTKLLLDFYIKIYKEVLSVQEAAKNGILSKYLLPDDLMERITAQINFDKPNVDLPKVDIYTSEFNRITKLNIKKTKFIEFEITLPLYDYKDVQELYKITSVVVPQENSSYITIQPIAEFISRSEERGKHTFYTQDQLNNCVTSGQDYYCDTRTVIYRNSSCELDVLTDNQHINWNKCNIIITNKTDNFWTPLNNPGDWLFSLRDETPVHFECSNKPNNDVLIQGYGLLSINANCQVLTNEVIFAHSAKQTKTKHVFFSTLNLKTEAQPSNKTIQHLSSLIIGIIIILPLLSIIYNVYVVYNNHIKRKKVKIDLDSYNRLHPTRHITPPSSSLNSTMINSYSNNNANPVENSENTEREDGYEPYLIPRTLKTVPVISQSTTAETDYVTMYSVLPTPRPVILQPAKNNETKKSSRQLRHVVNYRNLNTFVPLLPIQEVHTEEVATL